MLKALNPKISSIMCDTLSRVFAAAAVSRACWIVVLVVLVVVTVGIDNVLLFLAYYAFHNVVFLLKLCK